MKDKSKFKAVTVSEIELTTLCPYGTTNYLPNVSERPMLRFNTQIWYSKLVTIICVGCKTELRLD